MYFQRLIGWVTVCSAAGSGSSPASTAIDIDMGEARDAAPDVSRTPAPQAAIGLADPLPQVQLTGASPYTISVFTSLERCEAAWRQATAACVCSVFQTFEWLSAWFATVGRDQGASAFVVFVRDDSGTIVLAMALAVRIRRGMRCLEFLGGELTDYNMPLVHAQLASRIGDREMARIWTAIIGRLPAVDVILLRRVPASFCGTANPLHRLTGFEPSERAFAARLPSTFAEFATPLSTSFFKFNRWRRRRLADIGKVELVRPTDADQRRRIAQFIIDQKSRWQQRTGRENTMARACNRAFYNRLIEAHFAEGCIEVAALTVDGVITAGMWCAEFRSRYAMIVTTYDPDWSQHAVGRILTECMIQHCISRGDLECFDLTIGDESYKDSWADETFEVYDRTSGHSPKGYVFAYYLRARKLAHSAIRTYPTVRGAARRLVGTIARARARLRPVSR